MQSLVVEYEKFQRDRLPICSELAGHLIETSCTIMDLKGVGMSQFFKVKSYVQEASSSEFCFVFSGKALTPRFRSSSLTKQLPRIRNLVLALPFSYTP
jgi:hypothetical protein